MNRREWNQLAADFEDSVCDISSTGRGHVLRHLVSSVCRSSGRSLLIDLGCGIGSFIQRFGDRFEEVVGVDFSSRMLQRAKARCSALHSVRWLHLSIPDAAGIVGPTATLTVCLNVITSAVESERERLWSSLAAVTRAGGFVLLVVPSVESDQMVQRSVVHHRAFSKDRAQTNSDLVDRAGVLQKFYSQSELRETVARNGLVVKALRRVHYPWLEEGMNDRLRPEGPSPWDWVCLAQSRPGCTTPISLALGGTGRQAQRSATQCSNNTLSGLR